MIEQKAIVTRVDRDVAWVKPIQKQSCGSCSASGQCSTSGLFSFLSPKPQKLKVQNPLHTKPGQHVVIGLKAESLLLSSLLAYLLPLISLLIFAILGRELFPYFNISPEIGATLMGIGGLLAGLKAAHVITQHAFIHNELKPVILRSQGQEGSVSNIDFSSSVALK